MKMGSGTRCRRSATLVCALVAVLATPTLARAQEPPCGDTSFASNLLALKFAMFTDSGQAKVRGRQIVALSPDAVHRVVTDPRECRRVLQATSRYLPRRSEWGTHMIFRFGPYYAVDILQKLPPGVQSTGGEALTIFRASDMRYVAVVIGI